MRSQRHFALAKPFVGYLSAYANDLTGIIPDLYAALDVVSRELVGFLPSVSRSSGAERAAVGQSVVYTIAPEMDAFDIEAAMNVPEPPNLDLGSGFMAITKSKAVPFGFTGEEQRALNTGVGYLSQQAGSFAQALRTLVNEMERDVAREAAFNASRAVGTPGVTPFETNLKDTALLRKVLDDNGAPLSGRSAIVDTSAGANMRSLNNLARANEAGTTMTLRDGELLNLHGFAVKESAQVVNHVAGTGADYVTAGAVPVGGRAIPVSGGTGTILPGDFVSFAGDANRYQVETFANGVITIAKPGLRRAIPAAATAVTLMDDATFNVGFSSDAIHMVTRAPARPTEGDLAIDVMLITDPRSGMVFEVSVYPGYRKVRLEVAAAWGQKAVKREHIAVLFG